MTSTTARSATGVDLAPEQGEEWAYAPSTRVLWRSRSQLQLELGRRRVVVKDLSDSAAGLLGRTGATLDGPAVPGGGGENLDGLLDVLQRLGFLRRAERSAGSIDAQWSADRPALAPDTAALTERFGDGSADVMRRRRTRIVSVRGSGRLPALVAALLAAAGIGRVHAAGEGEVSLWDVMPGGLGVGDEGRRTASAVADAVQRAAPETDTRAAGTAGADLVIIAGATPVGVAAQRLLLLEGRPHLSASVWAASAVVGPLVVPRVTSCLGCADLHRQDRDPAWPALAVQLGAIKRVPSDVATCAFAAALSVMQALSYLDGEQPATIDGTLEMALPDWRIRRRSWGPHEHCGCRR